MIPTSSPFEICLLTKGHNTGKVPKQGPGREKRMGLGGARAGLRGAAAPTLLEGFGDDSEEGGRAEPNPSQEDA